MLLQRTYTGRKYPHIRTLSIIVQSGIRVRKHSGNIHSKITVRALLSQYVIQYYMNITSLECTKVRIIGDLQDMTRVDAHELERILES